MAFSVIYTIEFILKVTALYADYFRDNWNILDFVVVICIWIGYGCEFIANEEMLTGLAVIRVLQVVRLLKLVRQIALLRRCFQTFVYSI
jgi:hypothetical protein